MQRSTTIRFHAWLFALLPILLVAGLSAWGQANGSITGTVTDATGASVTSATLTAVQQKTGTAFHASVNKDGIYVFPTLPPTTYSISVTATGFNTYEQKDLLLQANQTMTVNVVLHVGQVAEEVTVTGSASQVDTTTSTLSAVMGEERVNELPLNGRNAAGLTLLVAGVAPAPNDNSDQGNKKTFPTVVNISASGSRADQTNYLLDGGNNIDEFTNVNAPFPFPDALQEFSVQTTNYNAEYGQNSGGVVNIVTKSGGNAFHGDLFEYLRNGAFNARNYFATSVDPLKRHQYGGTIGGPMIIPHLLKSKHEFFFLGYQHTQIHNQNGSNSAYVPTDANRSGDFSALLSATNPNNPLSKAIQIIDPLTGTPFSNNIIPTSRFDAAALAFVSHLPHATGNGKVIYKQPVNNEYNEFVARVDGDSNKDHIFGRYYVNQFTNAGAYDPTNLLTYSDQSTIRFQSALISDVHTFSANLLNSLVINYTREFSNRSPLGGVMDAGDFGVKMYLPADKAIQQINASGFFGIGDDPRAVFGRNNMTAAEDLHWILGGHNLAFGAHAEISKFDLNNQANLPGLFTFNSNTTKYSLASLQLGYMYQFVQGAGQYVRARNTFLGLYAQDSWKLNRRLTVNYGIRWEPFYPWHEVKDRVVRFDPEAYTSKRTSTVYTNAPAGLLFPGDAGVPERTIKNVYGDFMPRVGFAWDVFGTGRTSVRGGSGIFYNTRYPAIFYLNFASMTPFSLQYNQLNPSQPFSNPYLGVTNPFPTTYPPAKTVTFPSPSNVITFDPSGNYKVPSTYNWNLVVEHQLTQTLLLRAAYVGAHQSHMLTDLELNPAAYIAGSKLSTNARRPYAGYSTITVANMGANESYNALQSTIQLRARKNLTASLNYTWSKALDTLPLSAPLNALRPSVSYVYPYTMPDFKALDKGPSDFDRRSVISSSYVWTLPMLQDHSRALRAIVNHWNTSGIIAVRTGSPITITAGTDQSGTGLNQDRAVFDGSKAYGATSCTGTTTSCKSWLNTAAFTLPATGGFGNVRKSAFRGPGHFNWDVSATRDFTLYHEAVLRLRAEYFNVLNHTNFAGPTSSLSAAGFGTISSTSSDPRICQLSLKLQF